MRGLRRFLLNWQNLLALAIVGLFVCTAAAAPVLAPPPDDASNNGRESSKFFRRAGRPTDRTPHPPSEEAPLGTLPGQLDVFHSLIWGARHALRFGLVVSLCTGCLGVLVGAVSGYAGGAINRLMLRITDGFLAIPVVAGVGLFRQLVFLAESELTAPSVQVVLRLLGSDYVMLGLIVFSWMPYARIINASVARLLHTDYVLAARSVGTSGLRIILRHLLPNAIAPAVVLVARDIGAMVLLGAAFAFIGVGGDSPWGTLAVQGRNYVIGTYGNPLETWWVYVPVTLALILFGIGWNLLGDGLNDLLNPRVYRQRSRVQKRRKEN
jgi:peptide/nickel transport system permease protein